MKRRRRRASVWHTSGHQKKTPWPQWETAISVPSFWGRNVSASGPNSSLSSVRTDCRWAGQSPKVLNRALFSFHIDSGFIRRNLWFTVCASAFTYSATRAQKTSRPTQIYRSACALSSTYPKTGGGRSTSCVSLCPEERCWCWLCRARSKLRNGSK